MAGKHAFIKPLRYEGEEDMLPNFVLNDVRGVDALPMKLAGDSEMLSRFGNYGDSRRG